MMTKEEIQEWIDGEENGRRTKPNVYQGAYLTYSYAWSKALEYAKAHSEKEILEEYERAKTKDIDCMREYGHYHDLLECDQRMSTEQGENLWKVEKCLCKRK